MPDITYNTYIDWHGHNGLSTGLSAWYIDGFVGGPTLELSEDQVYIGDHSILWKENSGGLIWRPITLPPGGSYDITVWVYHPSASPGTQIEFFLVQDDEVGTLWDSVSTTIKDEWVPLTISYPGTESQGNWIIEMHHNAVDAVAFIGWSETRSSLDDVSCDVQSHRAIPDITYGRDSTRDLFEIRPGEVQFALNNPDGKYTPENDLSVLAGLIRPNRQVLIEAFYNEQRYILFNGYTDDYIVNASLNSQSVEIPCVDIMGRLGTIDISTDLFPSIRTGDAVKEILLASEFYPTITGDGYLDDETAVLFDPYVDSGASTLRWWGGADTALNLFNDVLDGEGPPSLIQIGASNQIIFKDRVNRLRAEYPTVPTATLVGDCEPAGVLALDESSGISYEWARIINTVRGSYTRRTLSGQVSTVWSQPGDVTWGQDSSSSSTLEDKSYEFTGVVDSGYIEAVDPVQGNLVFTENPGPEETDVLSGIFPEEHDYLLVSGDVELVDVKRSGFAISVTFADNTPLGQASTVRDMSLRARAVDSEQVTIERTSDASLAQYNSGRTEELDLGPITRPDAEGITSLVLQLNSFTRPVVTAILRNHADNYADFMLNVELGQLVQMDVDQWFLNEEFTVESITHRLAETGKDHTVELKLVQRTQSSPENAFTFDDPDRGFDQGVFAGTDINPDTVFILGASQLDSTDVLAY